MKNRIVAPNASMIDPAWLAKIVTEVLARIDAAGSAGSGDVTSSTVTSNAADKPQVIDAKVIDAKTIGQICQATVVRIGAKAVVTPAAKDEAKRRNITLIRGTYPSVTQQPRTPITSSNGRNDDQTDAVRSQLARRGIANIPECVVISETPAREVANQFALAKRAVMIGAIDDVKRFGSELDVDVWVLDAKKMNLMTIVNAVVAITRMENNGQ